MGKRKKRSGFLKINFILIFSVLLLNFLGVSYALWNDGLSINASVATGKIDPSFCKNYSIDIVRGSGNLDVNFEDKYTMNIQGEVEPDYKAFVNYCVKNEGTLPVKFVDQPQHSNDGLKLKVNQQSGILEPQENFFSETGNPKLQIQADEEGSYDFQMELLFSQWNID